jgi:excisionase family DNA binding protein
MSRVVPAESVSGLGKLAVSVEQAAHMLSIGRTTMFEIIGLGAVRTVKIGARRLVPVAELQRYVSELLEAA